MKKALFIFFVIFVTSCSLPQIGWKTSDVPSVGSGGVLETTSTWNIDWFDLPNTQTWLLDETNSWDIDDEEGFSWFLDMVSSWSEDGMDFENVPKVLSMESQFCKSKWWKVEMIDDLDICFITDEIWLLKCEVWVYYMDKCRDRSAIVKDGIIVSIPKSETKVVTTTKTTNDTSDNSVSTKKYTEINLGNGFSFRIDDNNKYLYLWDKLITKIDVSWKILMWVNNWSIYPFNIYKDKSDWEPTSIINVNILDKSFTEQITWYVSKITTSTWSLSNEDSTTNTLTTMNEKSSNEEKIKTWTTKIETWLSWTYYIDSWNFYVKTNSWVVRPVFAWTPEQTVYDFELLINKQVKVFYYNWENNKEDTIIDMNTILEN